MKNVPYGVIFSCKGIYLTKKEILFFEQTYPLGYVLFKRNFKNFVQLKKLIQNLKTVSKNKNALIFIDQEGGRVQRLRDDFFKKIPSQNFFEDIYHENSNKAIKYAEYCSSFIGLQLKQVGIDVNFSPVLDLNIKYANNIIGDRSFSYNPRIVSDLGAAYCKGLKRSGIIPVPKHFPGHGRSKFDSHKKLPRINIPLEDLLKNDLIPFMKCNNEIFIMVAHIVYSKIDNVVATYSKKIIDGLLIKNLKFRGLVISDDLSMKALKGSMKLRTIKTYDSGCDIILYCMGELNDMMEIYENAREIKQKKYNYLTKFRENLKTKTFKNNISINKFLFKDE
tara:strand:- start:133 stop:1140 length:1008 start_codon:yes stop_codon:yes gene_type:complete